MMKARGKKKIYPKRNFGCSVLTERQKQTQVEPVWSYRALRVLR